MQVRGLKCTLLASQDICLRWPDSLEAQTHNIVRSVCFSPTVCVCACVCVCVFVVWFAVVLGSLFLWCFSTPNPPGKAEACGQGSQ